VERGQDDNLRVIGGISAPAESDAAEKPRLRRLAYVEVELGLCEHCRQDARAHATDGLCWPNRRPRRRGRRTAQQYYRGRRTGAYIDLDSGEYLAAIPDPEARENVEVFRNAIRLQRAVDRLSDPEPPC